MIPHHHPSTHLSCLCAPPFKKTFLVWSNHCYPVCHAPHGPPVTTTTLPIKPPPEGSKKFHLADHPSWVAMQSSPPTPGYHAYQRFEFQSWWDLLPIPKDTISFEQKKIRMRSSESRCSSQRSRKRWSWPHHISIGLRAVNFCWCVSMSFLIKSDQYIIQVIPHQQGLSLDSLYSTPKPTVHDWLKCNQTSDSWGVLVNKGDKICLTHTNVINVIVNTLINVIILNTTTTIIVVFIVILAVNNNYYYFYHYDTNSRNFQSWVPKVSALHVIIQQSQDE